MKANPKDSLSRFAVTTAESQVVPYNSAFRTAVEAMFNPRRLKAFGA
jgi:hypothetical protein